MPIPLETPRALTPTVKLLEKKQEVVGYICDMRVVGVTVYGTREPKLKPDGSQQTQDKVTLLVKQGTARVKDTEKSTATEDFYRPVQPGEQVVIWFQGHRRWAWSAAKRELGTVSVGDVLRVVYTGDEPGKGAQPKKLWVINLRAGDRDKEAEAIDRCEAVWHELNTNQRTGLDDRYSGPEDGEPPW